jgi:hypothetical protein
MAISKSRAAVRTSGSPFSTMRMSEILPALPTKDGFSPGHAEERPTAADSDSSTYCRYCPVREIHRASVENQGRVDQGPPQIRPSWGAVSRSAAQRRCQK